MNTSLQSLAMEAGSPTSTSTATATDNLSPLSPSPLLPPAKNPPPSTTASKDRDFLLHLESYLAKRDGVDKLLKISRYASKIILASGALPADHGLARRLKSFESSVGLSRKAFRLGKFIQDVNALRTAHFHDRRRWILAIVAYGGEGIYFFVEQFVWLAKSGLIDSSHARRLQMVSAWAELVGYLGSVGLKMEEVKEMRWELRCLESKIEVAVARGEDCAEEREKEEKVRRKMTMKTLSIVQDVADALMAVADVRDGKGTLSSPIVTSGAGLLSALISTHKNWVSC